MVQLIEEMSAGPARVRVDVIGREVPEHVLENMDFLNYRLADVRLEPKVTLAVPDMVWDKDAPAKTVAYVNGVMRFDGDWDAGPLQKSLVALLALRMEAHGNHPFHSAAVRYHGKTVLFLGGESNHGKSMGQIEACRRGGQLISTETTVIDEEGLALVGSKTVFIKSRAKGTERADKAAPEAGVAKFFGEMPTWEEYLEPSNIDVVILPSIDGNYAASTVPMIPFERQFQTLHSLQNYLHLNELLAPGWPMPIMDNEELRRRRAAFLERFCTRPYYLIRAATPQVLMDEADEVI
ncbi:MAG TPA: hypothetical protein VM285_15655 [Polyangia bacterium]|nr:hypothetical protein [Polyangia bacterium]